MGTISGALRATTAVGVSVLLAAGALAGATTPAAAAAPFDGGRTTISGTASAMGQTNGPVWAVEVAAGRVYAGGQFTSTRPSGAARGTRETGQAGLAAFSASSGAPITAFRPLITKVTRPSDGGEQVRRDGVVRATVLSPDGRRLFVGGDFNRVDGQRAEYLAEFDATTGAFVGEISNPDLGLTGVDGNVEALAISPDGRTLYAGGSFGRAGTIRQARVAAFDLVANRVVESFTPRVQTKLFGEALRVTALGVSPDGARVFIGGPFGAINDRPVQGFAAVNAADGSDTGWRGDYLRGPRSWTTSIEVAGDTLYFGARSDNGQAEFPDRTEGVYAVDTATGGVDWYANCYGDTFGLQVVGSELYVASHAHDCSAAGGHPETSPRTYMAVTALDRVSGRIKPYFVQTQGEGIDGDSYYLSRALATDGRQLVMGGGYNRVNGQVQTNLSRFRTGSATPQNAVRPQVSTCRGCKSVRVRLTTGYDRDDVRLRYRVVRSDRPNRPIRTFTRQSSVWRTSTITFTDRSVRRGQKVFYRVRLLDPSGKTRTSAKSRTITVARP